MVKIKQQNESHAWRIVGKAVTGSAHIRQGLPRQDEICWWPEAGVGLPLVLAISDGHGSEAHFRSNTGANFAVNAAVDVLVKFAEVSHEQKDLSVIAQNAQRNLPREIHQKWLDLVADDVYQNQISREELASVETAKGISRRHQATLQPVVAYGATLLCALVTNAYILYLQLGDGDILSIDDTAAKVQRVIQKDSGLIGDETTSLCSSNASREFRMVLMPLSQNCPSLIIICTDGYSNSFADDGAFLKIGPDYLKRIKDKGLDYVESNLQRWLSAASEGGSGDDITVGLIFRRETNMKAKETHSEEAEQSLGLEPQSDPPKNSVGRTPDSILQDGVSKISEVSVSDERKD